ncbi:MAG TPA: SIMPL domain-containing protein [Rhizomicrobium sp.]|jgi:hypothetical protein
MKPGIFTSALVTAWLLAGAASAQPALQSEPRVLTVSGDGEIKAKPDQAMLSAGVVTEGRTAADALAANARKMNAVFETLKRIGIPDRAIQTSEMSVSPQYPGDSRQPRRITGYEVTNTVNVTVDDLDKIGPAIDALVNSGANSLGDIGFSIADDKPLTAQAREAAVKDATAKAETLARAAGVTLGPILSITEGGGVAEPMRPMLRMAMAAPASTPVAAGQTTVSATVSITWQIQ